MVKSSKNPQQNLNQVWFPGDHGCVGGGTKEQGLSDGALQWMIDESKADESKTFGLEFDESKVLDGINPEPTIPFDNTLKGFFALTGGNLREVSDHWNDLHESVIKRWIESNSDSTVKSKATNSETNLPYNPEKLISKHGVQLAQKRLEWITKHNNEDTSSGVG